MQLTDGSGLFWVQDESIDLPSERPLVLALDGERDIVLYEANRGMLTLRNDGPWVVDVQRVMESVANGSL
jgi:hypothetical protein